MDNELFGSQNDQPSENTIFTDKELMIIRLICEEKTTREIAEQTGLSQRSVNKYRQKLLIKTGAKSGVGILTYAIKNNIYIDT